MISLADAFLLYTHSSGKYHLFIVFAVINLKALMVNITTYKDGCDSSCIVNKGDH
ncbi:hypothetical protein MBAV_003421, partial [Candidatus Magnetobacterium bavaricum]